MPILKGKCQRCKDRHICGISEIVSPEDIDEVRKKDSIELEIKVKECGDYKREITKQ